jgi:hypothetical protein
MRRLLLVAVIVLVLLPFLLVGWLVVRGFREDGVMRRNAETIALGSSRAAAVQAFGKPSWEGRDHVALWRFVDKHTSTLQTSRGICPPRSQELPGVAQVYVRGLGTTIIVEHDASDRAVCVIVGGT